MTQMTTRSWQALPDTQRWWAEQPERIAQRLGLQHDIVRETHDSPTVVTLHCRCGWFTCAHTPQQRAAAHTKHVRRVA